MQTKIVTINETFSLLLNIHKNWLESKSEINDSLLPTTNISQGNVLSKSSGQNSSSL